MSATFTPPTGTIPTITRRLGPIERMRFRWQAMAEVQELTRDRAREDRIIAEGARHLMNGSSMLPYLFRGKRR